MGDLRDALKRAGLLSDQDERRLKHEERVHRKQQGREGLREERAQRDQRHEERREQRRQESRKSQEDFARGQNERARSKELARALERDALREGLGGPRRFHYVDRHGFLPYLQVNDEVGRRLEAGELAVVESPANPLQVLVVPRVLARELVAEDPDAVYHLAGETA